MSGRTPQSHRSGVGEQPFVDSGPTDGPAEALILDIGEDIGALILYADVRCLGLEIDLTPSGQPRTHHLHTMIRRRRAVGHEVIAGVFAHVVEGDYTVWGLDGHPLGIVTITGGEVAEFHGDTCGLRR